MGFTPFVTLMDTYEARQLLFVLFPFQFFSPHPFAIVGGGIVGWLE